MLTDVHKEVKRITHKNEAEVGDLARIKALLYHHLQQNTSSKIIGTLYLNLGQIYQNIKNYPLAHKACEQAQEYFRSREDSLSLATTYYQEGLLLFEEDEVIQAMKVVSGIKIDF